MNNKNFVYKKPECVPIGKQLFSADCNNDGAKKFIITTFDDAYQIIQETHNLYEDHTFNNMIKLHIDIDYNKDFSSELARDNMADEIIDNVSFTISGNSINNASGIYTIKYSIGIN